MLRLLLLLLGLAMALPIPVSARPVAGAEADLHLLTDFSPSSDLRWRTVNDDVMGGRSRGDFRIADGNLVFEGVTNTDGGGFSSIRTQPTAIDLSDCDAIRLRVRGDGRRYTFRLITSTARLRGRPLPYWAEFETRAGSGWQVVEVPLDRFRARWRGRAVRAPDIDRGRIEGLGLMIYDKRAGPFRLEVDWIGARRTPSPFSMTDYRWSKRPLVLFAPSDGDRRLVRQVELVTRTRAQFDERDMVLVVVVAEGRSRADARSLSTAESENLRRRFGVKADAFAVRLVGKDGRVKRASDGVVDVQAVYDLIDTMPMRRGEMRAARRGS